MTFEFKIVDVLVERKIPLKSILGICRLGHALKLDSDLIMI